MRRMNASKAEKEASEKKVLLSRKIAHDKPFLYFFYYNNVKTGRVSSILF
jgi:hypothetical protein